MKIEAAFVVSAAAARDFPQDGGAEVALVGRSNVGKSSLINALVRRPLARTSARPGKTRLANIYRVARIPGAPLYLVDLPGYGFAAGGSSGFDALARACFEQGPAALLVVDARHPGLDNDIEAWRWLQSSVERRGIIATKVDTLARGERIRAMRKFESVFEEPVLPVSAVTGEGLDELWKLIDKLAKSRNLNPPGNSRRNHPPKGTAPQRPAAPETPQKAKRSSASSWRRSRT